MQPIKYGTYRACEILFSFPGGSTVLIILETVPDNRGGFWPIIEWVSKGQKETIIYDLCSTIEEAQERLVGYLSDIAPRCPWQYCKSIRNFV